MQHPSQFVISLDFELMWGMFDKVSHATYGAHLDGVHEVLPKIVSLFAQHSIHATWATVGLLAYPNSNALDRSLRNITGRPQYINDTLSAFHHIETHDLDDYPEHYFAPNLIRQIVAAPHQELASHTFSHFYCLEPQTGGNEDIEQSFAADCRAMEAFGAQFSTNLTTIVFPRNQWSDEVLRIAAVHGITTYRGTENNFLYTPRNESAKTNIFLRGLRFLDRYYNLTGHHTFTVSNGTMINIPASRQLHPFSTRLAFLEKYKLRRIKRSMTHAAKRGEVFHLWWHPHNFGINQTENLSLLESILKHYQHLNTEYGMESKNMREVATQIAGPASPRTAAEGYGETPVSH